MYILQCKGSYILICYIYILAKLVIFMVDTWGLSKLFYSRTDFDFCCVIHILKNILLYQWYGNKIKRY